MRVHHLNCMSFTLGYPAVTHCLLVETGDGLAYVDAGLGLADYEERPWRVRVLVAANRVPCNVGETAVRQVVALGFVPEDVRHIVLTHLHLDHCGGIPDFPSAKVHVFAEEYQAAMHPRALSFLDLVGYEPMHWRHLPQWVIHGMEGDRWFGLDCAPALGTIQRGIHLVPLPGHSRGHCGVAVAGDDGWLLHCGDAYVRDMQIDPHAPISPFPTWATPLERSIFPMEARERLRGLLLRHSDEVKAFCSHDPIAFEALSSHR